MIEVPVEEMETPTDYKINLCFDWNDFDSCIEFQITIDGEIESKAAIIYDLIEAWDGIVEMEEGTVLNLHQFKQAFVSKIDEDEKKEEKSNVFRIVH